MACIRLLATDFDGTLLGSPQDGRDAYARFRQQIRHFRHHYDMQWAVITGRHVQAIPVVVGELLMHGLVPDFLVMEDACIYQRWSSRYWPCWWWNLGVNLRRRRQVRRHRQHVLAFAADVARACPDAENLSGNRLMDFWYRFGREEDASAVEDRLLKEFGGNSDFFVFRWGLEVCLAPTAGTKGEAVARLASKIGAIPKEIAAIGDGQNDISMLDGVRAGYPACVANASLPVLDTIIRSRGYIARQPVLHGVVEFLDWLEGKNKWTESR